MRIEETANFRRNLKRDSSRFDFLLNTSDRKALRKLLFAFGDILQ